MSARKRKASLPDMQQLHESIKDLLSKTKPQLDDPKPTVRASLVKDLHQVAALAESITDQRPKSTKSWVDLADSLDREGVDLWNISGTIRKTPEFDNGALLAALRLASFRLVEAGLESSPDVATLLHVLQLASKTGATLSEYGSRDAAASVLTSAAKFEEQLRNADDPSGAHRQVKACATIVYFASRMEAAWKEGNYSVAEFMSQKITEDDDQRLAILPPYQRELLAIKFHNIGKSMMKGDSRHNPSVTDGVRAHEAVRWYQKAFGLVERLEESDLPGIAELKIAILRSLARAYFLSSSQDPENLSRAEATLQELIPSIDASSEHASSEYLELRWQRLAILKRRKAGESAILDAYKSIIDHMLFTETSITELVTYLILDVMNVHVSDSILQDLRTLNHQHALVTAVSQYCLKRAIACHEPESGFVDRLLLSLIFHCSKDEDHARAIQDLNAAFTYTSEADYVLPSVPTTACLTLMWQYGDRHYHAKRWSEAADWFIASSHKLFRNHSSTTSSKCLRKAALCYIEQKEYAKASAIIRRCSPHEATTHYIMLLAAVHQGLDDEAIRAVNDMVKAPDFDRRMLLLATQLSHTSEMKTLLLTVLEALFKTLKFEDSGETAVEAMSLLRCIIRLVLKLLAEPGANMPVLIDTLVNHFQTAKILTEAACAQKAISILAKDISWLWRTAYNSAVQGCSEWEGYDDKITELFEITRDLLESYCQASPVDVDAEFHLHLANASFSAVCGRVFASRVNATTDGPDSGERIRSITADVKACKVRVCGILGENKLLDADDIHRVQYFLHLLRVFEVEMLTKIKQWDEVSQTVTEITHSDGLAVDTYEAIADILWVEKDCPVNVLYAALEAILHSSLDHGSLSVEKFARWLRAICTIILSRNTAADRAKAIGYVEQAVGVIEENQEGEDPYPMEERQWLLSTSYNTGMECLHASSLDEAKRWFEASTITCKFVQNGQQLAERLSDTYTHLLARYSRSYGKST